MTRPFFRPDAAYPAGQSPAAISTARARLRRDLRAALSNVACGLDDAGDRAALRRITRALATIDATPPLGYRAAEWTAQLDALRNLAHRPTMREHRDTLRNLAGALARHAPGGRS